MTKAARQLPLVIIEEHHEAFYVWQYAIRRGWLAPSGNTLLHVDAHADMWLPRLRRPLRSGIALTELAHFVYSELDIGSFIWPAVYLGHFNRVLWLRHEHKRTAGGWRKLAIMERLTGPREFQLYPADDTTAGLDPERSKIIEYCPVTTHEMAKTDQPVVLDIDLDYFCSNPYPDLPHRDLEITAHSFRDFTSNRYHFLRLNPGDKISAAQHQGKYYICYNNYRSSALNVTASRAKAARRLADFLRYLESNSIVPKLIIVCRSYFSGYTPGALVDELQAQLVFALSSVYQPEIFSIDDILPVGLRQATRRKAIARGDKSGVARIAVEQSGCKP